MWPYAVGDLWRCSQLCNFLLEMITAPAGFVGNARLVLVESGPCGHTGLASGASHSLIQRLLDRKLDKYFLDRNCLPMVSLSFDASHAFRKIHALQALGACPLRVSNQLKLRLAH